MLDKDNPIDLTFREAAQKAASLAIQGAQGRQEAARILLKYCGGRLHSYIRNKSFRRANHEDAEEMVADTVMKFINSAAEIPADCAKDAWLYTIARNVVIDWQRRQITEKRGGTDG
ncbi:MAG: sigma factor, partial [Pseudomonadota bacterium]